MNNLQNSQPLNLSEFTLEDNSVASYKAAISVLENEVADLKTIILFFEARFFELKKTNRRLHNELRQLRSDRRNEKLKLKDVVR